MNSGENQAFSLRMEDLLDICGHIAADDMRAASRVYDQLRERMEILSRFPKAGPARGDVSAEARGLSEPPYPILYREIAEGVQVVRVLRGARRIVSAMLLAGVE
jgi:toxin ParE1/3/4